MKTTTARRLAAGVLATAAAGAVLLASPALAATAPHVRYFATAGHQFGPPVTGNADQAINTLTARYKEDPAQLAVTAQHDGYPLPGGARWLIAHPQKWAALAAGFGSYLHAHVVEEVKVDEPYTTMYAIGHYDAPTTFAWTSEPAKASDVLVFNGTHGEFYLRMNCGGQIMEFRTPIPLPSKPASCTTAKGKHVGGCAPCRPGTRLFHVPGVGAMCLCPQTIHVIVSQTRTVSVEVITTVTDTTSTTTQVSYGPCSAKCKN